jgi:hypothetical protein
MKSSSSVSCNIHTDSKLWMLQKLRQRFKAVEVAEASTGSGCGAPPAGYEALQDPCHQSQMHIFSFPRVLWPTAASISGMLS